MSLSSDNIRPQGEELDEEKRREVFRTLVDAQDNDVPVPQSRQETARKFGLTEAEVWQIEREGLDNGWPPL